MKKKSSPLSNVIIHKSFSNSNNNNNSSSSDCNGNAAGDNNNDDEDNNRILDPNNKPACYGATTTSSVANGGDGGGDNNLKQKELKNESNQGDNSVISVSDIIGSFGWFQFMVLLFSGLREAGVGYDAVVMSIILQPESNYVCADQANNNLTSISFASSIQTAIQNTFSSSPNQLETFLNGTKFNNETAECFRHSNGEILFDISTGKPSKCNSWKFPHYIEHPEIASLVAEWSLVCDRHWLVAFIESAYFFGLVFGNLCWGYYADKVGRRKAYLVAHSMALVFGMATIFATTITLFAICRFFSAFGSIGYNIIYSIQVELIGTKHRSFSTTLNHLGWGLGVICVPFINHLFSNYRYIIAVAPIVALIMFPWTFWLPESSRWLMANNKFSRARQELIRAAKFNGIPMTPLLDKKIMSLLREGRKKSLRLNSMSYDRRQSNSMMVVTVSSAIAATVNGGDKIKDKICGSDFQIKPKAINDQLPSDGGANGDPTIPPTNIYQRRQSVAVQTYRLLFKNPILVRDTIVLAYVSFIGHLFYYLLTINFGYMKNLSVEANFIISGAGEWVSVIVGAILLKFCSRKTCMSLFLFLMACSFSLQALIDSNLTPQFDTQLIVTANNGVGTLSALLLIFIALIVNQEVYPTVIRQTGSSIVNTLGESGSTLSPVILQLARIIGLWKADLFYAIMCSLGIIGIQFISKTDDIELADG